MHSEFFGVPVYRQAPPHTSQPNELPPLVAYAPLYDNMGRIIAYELSILASLKDRGRLVDLLPELDFQRLLAHKKVFLSVTLEELGYSNLLRFGANLVLVPALPQGRPLSTEERHLIVECKAHAVRLAFQSQDVLGQDDETQLWLAEIASLLIHDFANTAEPLRPFFIGCPPFFTQKLWWGRNIRTPEEFALCRKGAFRFALYHGHGASKSLDRGAEHKREINSQTATLLRLMGLLRRDAANEDLREVVREDAGLLYRLFRLINYAGNGLSHEVRSINDALFMIGRNPLLKWCAMLIFTSQQQGADDFFVTNLLERALTRAEFLEKLAQSDEDKEQLYMLGMFLQLDQLLGVPMEEAIAELALPAPVSSALLDGSGHLVEHIALLGSLEEGTIGTHILNVPEINVNRVYMDSLIRSQELKLRLN